MQKECIPYAIRFQQNIPCNLVVLSVFLLLFCILDHIRGLCCVISVFCVMAMHVNKNENHPGRNHNAVAMCTSNQGIHRSCSAVYFWCASNGLAECLALSIYFDIPFQFLPKPAYIGLIIALWLATLLMCILFYDSTTVAAKQPPSQSEFEILPLDSNGFATIPLQQQSVPNKEKIARAPRN